MTSPRSEQMNAQDILRHLETLKNAGFKQDGNTFEMFTTSANGSNPLLEINEALDALGIAYENSDPLSNPALGVTTYAAVINEPESVQRFTNITSGAITPAELAAEAAQPEAIKPIASPMQTAIDEINAAGWQAENGGLKIIDPEPALSPALREAGIEFTSRTDTINFAAGNSVTTNTIEVTEPEAVEKLNDIRSGAITAQDLADERAIAEAEAAIAQVDNPSQNAPDANTPGVSTWEMKTPPSHFGAHNTSAGPFGSTVDIAGGPGQLTKQHDAVMQAADSAIPVPSQPEPEVNAELISRQNWKMDGGSMELNSTGSLDNVAAELEAAGIEFDRQKASFGSISTDSIVISANEDMAKLEEIRNSVDTPPAPAAIGGMSP